MSIRRGWIAALALVLAACTMSVNTSATDGPVPSWVFDSLQPSACPDVSAFTKMTDDNKIAGMGSSLIPGHPTALVVCRPDGQRGSFEGGDGVAQIAHQLNGMELLPRRQLVGCADGSGGTYGLFFDYPTGESLLISVDAGCGVASNGRRAVASGALTRLMKNGLYFG